MSHDAHASGVLPSVLALVLVGAGYLHLAGLARRRNPVRGWSRWRTACFAAGLALVAVALLPPVASFAGGDFRGHVVQHLLIGMYAPLGLVLGAPVTLLLRTAPPTVGRRLTALLRSGPVRVLNRPEVALLLSAGGLVVLYATPLHEVGEHPGGHWLLFAHFLLAGYLFAHVIAGPDPAPGRPGVRTRLVYLGCAIAVHAVTAQLMYGGWTAVHGPAVEVRGGAELMYYAGDVAELLLAGILVATWHPERSRRVG
ncbi:cytochrome c oxidase assembly protein [Saccharopolyspora gregorii]|uniref:Cytochrome c oxidase assembly protein n=1 Tax=Saccharopolyspora gregorii TaxID=33914 RepID=A0ABP6S031_9PSEU|nr:cytochrome c oxidase assembly protein [Saccharopolyspora gregorii]